MKTPSNIFQKLLDYAYTGHCDLNSNNVETLLRYADQYEVLGVVQICCHYILGSYSHLISSDVQRLHILFYRSTSAVQLFRNLKIRPTLLL